MAHCFHSKFALFLEKTIFPQITSSRLSRLFACNYLEMRGEDPIILET